MKEIVQKILETEKAVRESIERAHSDAQTIVRDAENQSGQVEEKVREQAMREAQEIAERMKREGEAERQRQIENAQGGSTELIKKKSAEIKRVAEQVTNLVIGVEQKQGKLL